MVINSLFMNKRKKYFEFVKNQCVLECKQSTHEDVARKSFSKPEVIDLFLEMEKNDQAYTFVVDSMKGCFDRAKIKNIYVPGGGVGGLARMISDRFSKPHILQVDFSKEMVTINNIFSKKYKNIVVKKGNILNFKIKANSLDCIIAYGVMRYIPENKMNVLLDLWSRALVPGGVVIVGEGRGKEIVGKLDPKKFSSVKSFSKKIKLFRCSLFYLLCKRYNVDKIFRKEVEKLISTRKNFADILKGVAGFVSDEVYIKEFKK